MVGVLKGREIGNLGVRELVFSHFCQKGTRNTIFGLSAVILLRRN